MQIKREQLQLGGFLKASIADLITLLSSTLQNSEDGGDGDCVRLSPDWSTYTCDVGPDQDLSARGLYERDDGEGDLRGST
jgi:hypothetical protein